MKKAADIIRTCLEEKGISQRQLATSMGEDVRKLNQQLVRQDDMKVERFAEVLDHLGYRVEIVENDGIRKVSQEYVEKLIEAGNTTGRFWYVTEGRYTGVILSDGTAIVEVFVDKEVCFKWLKGNE